jgi:hypothetical protein
LKNPISPENRTKIYLAGEIVADTLIAAGVILAILGYVNAETIIGVVAGLVTRVVSKLARTNVTTEADINAKVEEKVAANVEQDLQFASTRVPRHRAEESSAIG